MDRTASHSARTASPASPQEDGARTAVPPCIAAILRVVSVLLGYGKHLDQILPYRADHPHFPVLAAGFGTHDIRRILGHVQRGILRAMMLQRFLLARAAQGRDIEPTERPAPAEAEDIEAMEIKLRPPSEQRSKTQRARRIDPDDPVHFDMPTLKELEAQVRCRPIGRTIADICMDLGIEPPTCEAGFWHQLCLILTQFGGNFETFFGVRERRKKAFEKERQTRPQSWSADWRDRPRDAIRALLGYVVGESPPDRPPIESLLKAAS